MTARAHQRTLFEIVHINGTERDIYHGFHDPQAYQQWLSSLSMHVRTFHEKGISILYRPNLNIETDQTPIRILEPEANDPRIQALAERLPFLHDIAHIPLTVLADSPLEDITSSERIHERIILNHQEVLFGGKYQSGCVLDMTHRYQMKFPAIRIWLDKEASFEGNWFKAHTTMGTYVK